MYKTIIQAQELQQHLNDEDWIIVDCRYDLSDKTAGYRSYIETHIPKAVYADIHDDLSSTPVTDHGRHPLPAPSRLNQVFSSLGIEHNSQVIAYDASSGAFAARLWWLLRYMGHEAVAVLDGGWSSWSSASFETEQHERKNNSSHFTGEARKEWLVTLDDVLKQKLLVDSREPARYTGEQEPIDPIAGHIPGAINHFWKKNLADNGKFLASQQVRQDFLRFYGDMDPEQVVFYCGSGVTACHNLLAAEHAGLPSPRLYAGSWSEWCSEPARPVALGNE